MKTKPIALTPQLTKEEKIEKQQRQQFEYQIKRLKGAYSFKQINTLKDLLVNWGYDNSYIASYFPSELSKKITFVELNDFVTDRIVEFNTAKFLQKNPPITDLLPDELEIYKQATAKPLPPEQFSESKLQLYAEKIHTIPAVKEEDNFEEPVELKDPNIKVKLFWFQNRALKYLIDSLLVKKHRADMLIAGTGTGKTYIVGALLAYLKQIEFIKNSGCMSPWPIVYITKASIVEQTRYVLYRQFNLTQDDVTVVNIDKLRAKFGQLFITEEVKIKDGIEHTKYVWRAVYPMILLIDECQSVKNTDTKQSRIIQSYNEIDIDDNDVRRGFSKYSKLWTTYSLYLSATPGSRVEDFKCFAVATRIPYTFGLQKNAPLTNNHWNDFAKNIASDYGSVNIKPTDHSPKAADRLMEFLNPFIYRVKGVKTQFKAINTVQLINFSSAKAKQQYEEAWEKFLEKKAKLEAAYSSVGEGEGKNYMNVLSMLLCFRLAAESNDDRCEKVAAAMFDAVTNHKQAAISANNFKLPICKIVKLLIEKYKVPRSKISLIWGGAPQDNKKQKLKKKVTENQEFFEALKKHGITLKDLDLDEVEDKEAIYIDPSYRLGTQSAKERQREIEKFQRGESLYCLFTFRAGGVGLSLHHTDEFTTEKVRKKKSGYAYEEDIPKIPTRQRITFLSPTWSAQELVQGLGRAPRLTSLSDTSQILMYYAGTIEEQVARVVKVKLHCLSRICRTNESWEDLYTASPSSKDVAVTKHIENTPTEILGDEDEENGIIGDVEIEDEEVEQMIV